MSDQLLVRDVMRIGVPTCKPEESISAVAAQMLELGCTAMVVLDEDGDARGWLNETMIARCLQRVCSREGADPELSASDVMSELVPDCPSDIPLTAAVELMRDRGVDHMFFMHHAGGRAWPASVLSMRDVVRAIAGPEHLAGQGAGAPRPSPIDLFRQRYGLPKK